MTDKELIVLLRSRMIEGTRQAPFAMPDVVQKDQPTQQGIGWAPAVYFQKLSDRRYGWSNSKSIYDDVTTNFIESERQLYETTFQISALAIQDPEDGMDKPTASDMVNFMAMWLNHRATIEFFMQQKVSVLRVTDVRHIPFEDDRHRSEYHPTFDLVMTHARTLDIAIPSAIVEEGKLYPI